MSKNVENLGGAPENDERIYFASVFPLIPTNEIFNIAP